MTRKMAINREIRLQRGVEGFTEENCVKAFIGEYAVFYLPLESGGHAELRMPVSDCEEENLLIASDGIVFGPEDYEEDEQLG